jgi:SAM-dependent methyltransferase
MSPTHKIPLPEFLARNPFPGPLTDGLFFRDKMRALHRIAPEAPVGDLLEIGGGRSGLSAMLYPAARVVNLDIDPALADAPCNRDGRVRFVQGDATRLPFADASFDMVTMFDLLEHVEDDAAAAREALRVLRPGGWVLVSTPDRERWRFPYYGLFRPIARDEAELFAEWGHVRRGYTRAELNALFGDGFEVATAFINPLLALSHDVSFSRLGRRKRRLLHLLVAPFSLVGWFVHGMNTPGTEIAARWRRPATAVAAAA